MGPSDPLHANRRLSSNNHDFLAFQIFLMDLEEMVVRKDWCFAIEIRAFPHFDKGSEAHTTFDIFLKSVQGLQINRDMKCYFRDFLHFREVLLRLFNIKLKDPIAVIEKNIRRIKLTLT